MLKKLYPVFSIYIISQVLLRIGLLIFEKNDIDYADIFKIFKRGFAFDLYVLLYICILPIIYFSISTRSYQNSKLDIKIRFLSFWIFCFLLIFVTVSEIIFWIEFRSRFNFIAIDYLIYTHEVIGNIKESYPIFWIMSAIFIVSFFITSLFNRFSSNEKNYIKDKLKFLFFYLCCFIISHSYEGLKDNNKKSFGPIKNSISNEISQNGIYSFFYALRTSNIPFEKFYLTLEKSDIKPNTTKDHNPKNYNVIMIVMESMSAKFMSHFGNKEGITPNLDSLVNKSVFLSKLYATGTRTIRGLESLFLGIPPSPGDSIIKRPNNDNLYSIGSILKEKGYRNVFIYGGYGYFDNMNEFFGSNNCEIIDRSKIENVTFSNIWGVCDEDLLNQTLKEANKQSPFFFIVMTTSNHRPYTYPSGKIDIPSKTGRGGAIKYADYAIGHFLNKAKKESWFKNTIFVIVSDHTAGSSGKIELDLEKHHIPAFIYAPFILEPRVIDKVCSQIDIAPTILNILGFGGTFIGQNMLKDDLKERAFISNYQKYGFYNENDKILTVIKPIKDYSTYKDNMPCNNDSHLNETIQYYQWSSEWKNNLKK